VTKKIIHTGEGNTPKEGDAVEVHYEGRLTDGTIFDSSFDSDTLKVKIGTGAVIRGWDIGIMSMKLGERAELTIGPEYGYGKTGAASGKIPANSTLIFTVELVKCENKVSTKMIKELLENVERLKNDGNAKFKAGNFKSAKAHYSDALSHLSKEDSDNEELRKMKLIVL